MNKTLDFDPDAPYMKAAAGKRFRNRLASSGCLRPELLTLCLLLVILFGQAFKVSAERSVTLTIRENPLPGIDIGNWNDAKVDWSSGIILEADYTADSSLSGRSLYSYFNSNPGILALTKMEVIGYGAQLLYAPLRSGGKVPYIVMSADYRNASGSLTSSPLKSKIILDLAEFGEGWNLNAIGLEVVNYDRYRNFKNSEATGIIYVNGHELHAPDNAAPEEIRADLSADGPVKQITIATDEHASVGFRAITLYLGGESEFVELDDDRAATPDYNSEGVYRLPYAAVGGIAEPDLLSCAIFDAAGKRMNVTALYNPATQYFSVNPSIENGDILDEGYYRAVYYIDDSYYEPKAEDGAEFAILPSAQGMYLNWKPIDPYSSMIWEVPSHTIRTDGNGNTIQHDWEHVLVNGFRSGTIVYWKVTRDEDRRALLADPAVIPSGALTAVGPSSEIPDGYQRLSNQSADLSRGNRLSLILQRNGVNSYPINIDYTKVDIPTLITEVSSESVDVISSDYYDMTGRRIMETGNHIGRMMLKVDRMADGSIRTTKFLPHE